MNPALPLTHFIPDVEARVWDDGRLYCYGSQDISGNHSYCSHRYRVFSTDDLVTWQDHGESFASDGPHAATPWSGAELYAPDCVCRDDVYYLYFCQKDRSEGVAVSERPEGPFTQATTIPGPHGDAIDPAAFVDDDGQAYLYWGQHHCRGARLQPDMRHIDADSLQTHLLVEERHGFHEGPCMRKRGDKYYLIYCDTHRGRATCLSYAIGDSPLGPFEKGGTIIDNTGCDPLNWNNHGSIAAFRGRWYVFYHRASQGSNFNRRLCVEPITFDDAGHIAEVEMTTQGVEPPLPATRELAATRACLLAGDVRSAPADSQRPADRLSEYLSRIQAGDQAVYKYLDFDRDLRSFHAQVATPTAGGIMELRIDRPDGPCLGTCDIPHTGGWQHWQRVSCPVRPTPGVHALYLVFRHRDGESSKAQIANLESFRFAP